MTQQKGVDLLDFHETSIYLLTIQYLRVYSVKNILPF